MSKKEYFVGVAGNIGVGKTTMTDIIADHFGWKSYYESVIDNPYLDKFYHDMKRWSFHLQIYFLSNRFRTHKQMIENSGSAIQDRTIYEDVEIFARNLHEMGNMDKTDWDNYRSLFTEMTAYLKKPDLIIYLKASVDTLITRIKKRSRDYEKTIDPEYLYRLNVSYDQWIKREQERNKVMIIETDDFNVFEHKDQLNAYFEEIRQRLGME
ncbi:MAG: deoxynucleoside kinase [Candidatus Marinimicrobia bacterium]|nr:deoxynucleoside kinase [Candidatus Neomarinimicrobiota bacterium]